MANLVILDKVSATASIYDVVALAGAETGNIVVLGARQADGTHVVAANVAATDNGMVMILPVNLPYGAEVTENNCVIATGSIQRAYVPYEGMVVSIPQANITATSALAEGKVVVPKVGVVKVECLATAVGTEAVIFAIDQLYTKAGVAMAKLRCVKA